MSPPATSLKAPANEDMVTLVCILIQIDFFLQRVIICVSHILKRSPDQSKLSLSLRRQGWWLAPETHTEQFQY